MQQNTKPFLGKYMDVQLTLDFYFILEEKQISLIYETNE